jgi:hypothetical protein
MNALTLVGFVLVSGALGGVATVLHDISNTLKRIEGRMSKEK